MLIKIVKVVVSFYLALLIVAIPFMCALSYALNWNAIIKFIFTMITIVLLYIGTALIYWFSDDM